MDGTARGNAEEDHARIHGLVQKELKLLGRPEELRARREPSRDERSSTGGAPGPILPTEHSAVVDLKQDLCGLALSGGGIRSATFNLGLLQAFHQMGLLKVFDYVATVSGGGYIGGFWSSWRTWHAPQLFPEDEQGARGADLPEVRHLRQYSNFLVPRLGLLSIDTSRLLGSLLIAIVPSLLVTLSLILLALGAWALLAWGLLSDLRPGLLEPFQGFLREAVPRTYRITVLSVALSFAAVGLVFEWVRSKQEPAPGASRTSPWRFLSRVPVPLLALLVLGLGGWSVLVWRLADEGTVTASATYQPISLVVMGVLTLAALVPGTSGFRWRGFVVGLAAACALGLWWLMGRGPGSVFGPALDIWLIREGYRGATLFAPCLAWLGTVAALVMLRWIFSRATGRWVLDASTTLGRVISLLLLMSGGWATFAAFWWGAARLSAALFEGGRVSPDSATRWLVAGSITLALVLLMGLFTRVQQLASRATSKPVEPGGRNRFQQLLPQLLAYAALGLMVFAMARLLFAARQGGPWWLWQLLGAEAHWGLWWLGGLIGTALAITVFSVFAFDANNIGLHAFYRSRLARAYLGAGHGQAGLTTEPQEQDDLRLDLLEPRAPKDSQGPGPLHLICCTANDLSSDSLATLYRGSESAVLSRVGFSVGGHWVSWGEVREPKEDRIPTLAAAITASGAALNSHMGARSVQLGPAVTFLMTAFNLRLGLWWPHPKDLRKGPEGQGLKRRLAGESFYKELFGKSRVAEGQDVLLSDGGHFENLALYELVRRHCRYIVVSDCGMDASTIFDDFANAVRRVREDFGVEIRIDLAPLRPGPDGLAQQPMVAGDIEYPSGDMGVLLLLKPTLGGHEPADITQYKRRNQAFPHETTGDQFYDEAQWESYRRLGEHVARMAFQPILGTHRVKEREEGSPLFARARHEWLPAPSGYEQRFPHYVEHASELERLVRSRSPRLFKEVFQELGEVMTSGVRGPFSLPWPPARRLPDGRGLPLPRRRDFVESLHLSRRALLLMQEVFLTEDLANHHNHPVYLGVINYFSRWTGSPLFRMWWPLLKGLYPLRFTRFLEARFGLPESLPQDPEALSLQRDTRGFAMRGWLKRHPDWQPGGPEQLIAYRLRLPYGGRVYPIQAALLLARLHDHPVVGAPTRLLAWSARDFYVPPGLWGIGIGEQFLRTLIESRDQGWPGARLQGALKEVATLVTEIEVNRDASPTERKAWADEMQLYRASGFTQPGRELLQGLNALRPRGDPGRLLTRWLVEDGAAKGARPLAGTTTTSSFPAASAGVALPH